MANMQNLKDRCEELLSECQTYKYNQSSNFIQLSRTVVFGIIGTIWILSYSHGSFTIHNTILIVSLILAFIHILIDLLHYFCDMVFYKREYVRFASEQYNDNAIKNHDDRMDNNAKKSFLFVVVNSAVLLLTVICFIVGFISQYSII